MDDKEQVKRRSLRFDPDDNAVAYISRDVDKLDVDASIAALPINESFDGVSLITLVKHNFSVSEKLLVKVGKLAPMLGEVKWVKELDSETVRVGFHYL